MTIDTHLDDVVEKAPSESERWKNRYLVTIRTRFVREVCWESRELYAGDDFLVGCCVTFPSRAVAEKNHEDNTPIAGQLGFKYLGPIRL